MIKNEEDILETFIRHNLNYLDFLVLADNSSTDNSRIIIKKLMQEGLKLCVIDDRKMAYTQTDKITNLYRRVATSFFPEFIVPIDADELIQSPSKESFINSLQAIPKNGIGIYPWKTYIPDFSAVSLVFFWFRRNPVVIKKKQESNSENSYLQSWDKLIAISQIPYEWYGKLPQIISEILEMEIPDNVYSTFTK